jgi:hypothetical protein
MGKRKREWIRRSNIRRAELMKHHRISPIDIRREGVINTALVGSVLALETPKRVVLMHTEWVAKIYSADL